MIRKIARKIKPRRITARLKYSYRPRLRSLLSADTGARRRGQGGNGHHAGLGRKIIILAILGTAGFWMYEQGAFSAIKERTIEYAAQVKAMVPSGKTVTAGKAIKNGKGVPSDSTAKALGIVMKARNLWNSHFGPQVVEESPVAFVKLKDLQGIGASGAILPIRDSVFYDMPVISGAFAEDKMPGDTLKEASLALSIILQAEKCAPGLLKRTSELIVKGNGEVQAVFSDTRLGALLGPDHVQKQLTNLSAYLDKWVKEKKGTINMIYGDIAFITEEEKNE